MDDREIKSTRVRSRIPLDDELLEKVGGGFNGINTCRRRFEEYTCLNAYDGRCPDLIIINEVKSPIGTTMTIACNKSYFGQMMIAIRE